MTYDPVTMAVLVNLAQRVRIARRNLRRVSKDEGMLNADTKAFAFIRENEAWNAFQASKKVANLASADL